MKLLVDIAIGILLYILLSVLQIPIAFLFRDPFMGSGFGERIPSLIYEYLIGAVIVFLLSMALAWIFRTKSKRQARRRAIVWTLTSALLTLALEVINIVDIGEFGLSTLGKTVINSFGNIGFYAVLLGIFLGPLVYAKIKHLDKPQPNPPV